MSVSVGTLSLMSLRNPFVELVRIVLGKGSLRTIFCFVVFFIVSGVLAYLTNPSENSFRAYLTEQSFRQHLRGLDENLDDDVLDNNIHRAPATKRMALNCGAMQAPDTSPPFHFANRASVSLRTPKHVFHSFAIFTIAAMVPLSSKEADSSDQWLITDSWFIGAFGKWWRGGVLETWYQDVISRSKDEESWSSGILGMKSDMPSDYDDGKFTSRQARRSQPSRRDCERLLIGQTAISRGSRSPPPLPKTASLPLHVHRSAVPSDRHDDYTTRSPVVCRTQPSNTDSTHVPSSLAPNASSVAQSPMLDEVIRQISESESLVKDLRSQLSESQNAASMSHGLLQAEVDSYRHRKRQEDAAKVDVKTRTKALDDSRRQTECLKRDTEKKLKLALSARDSTQRRIEHLGMEIAKLQNSLLEHEKYTTEQQVELFATTSEVTRVLAQNKADIKIAEEHVATLSQRARELEERLAEERAKLHGIKGRTDQFKQRDLQCVDHCSKANEIPEFWPSAYALQAQSLSRRALTSSTLPSMQPLSSHLDRPFRELSQRPSSSSDGTPGNVLRGNGTKSILTALLNRGSSTDRDALSTKRLQGPDEKASYIDIALQSIFEGDSTQSEKPEPSSGANDNSVDLLCSASDASQGNDWPRTNSQTLADGDAQATTPGSFTSLSLHGSNGGSDHDPLEIHASPTDAKWECTLPRMPLDGWSSPSLPSDTSDVEHMDGDNDNRPWILPNESVTMKSLNPNAKLFNLPKKPKLHTQRFSIPHIAFDALNPNGLNSSTLASSTSADSSLLRAFAPSPAERQVLQRAFAGSTNTSLERLPSLSDVASIPVTAHRESYCQRGQEDMNSLPSWWKSWPRIGKVNFSPWGDEDADMSGASGKDELVG